MLTIKKVNAELTKAGYGDVELVRGEGYFYFAPLTNSHHYLDHLDTTSVMVNRLNDLPIEEWISELASMKQRAIA